MKRLAAVLFLVLSQTALAQTVVVKSGDHAGFTRLVLELPQAMDWEMGRTDEGYALRLKSDGLRFDLTRVFDEIQRNRLAAIWMDPATGSLRLGVACACHAIPFEFRPGIIVVDLQDGPPPKGSSFELALDGSQSADLAARASPRPRSRPRNPAFAVSANGAGAPHYDWLAPSKTAPRAKATAPPLLLPVIVEKTADIGPLKEALLRQLGRGAAQGIVQMAQPSLSARNAEAALPIGPRANIHLGDVPGFDVSTKRAPENLLINDGADCIADDRLDLARWGNDLPVSVQLADARANLIGEFDKPNRDAVITAAKLLIHIGFGAEAQQMLAQMPVDDPDAALWASMAKLVDGASDAGGPFGEMATCDTAAALWAALALPQLAASNTTATDAILRSFSALPAHLRSALGPDLAAKFLAADNILAARTIQNAVMRAAHRSSPDIALMEAGIALAAGDPSAAAAHLEPVIAQAGPATADAMIALVNARFAAKESIDPQTAIALAALVREQAGSDLEPALRRAQILALGSSGDFDQAFALLPQMPVAERDLWTLLAGSGSDAAILGHAVLPPDAELPALDQPDRNQIAGHLIDLGLADVALLWIGTTSTDSAADQRVLAARANLMISNPEATLAQLEGLQEDPAFELRALAFLALGKPTDAAAAWAAAGNSEAELRAQSWARSWDELAQSDRSLWQSAATLMTVGSVNDLPGPLALGNALVADSAMARATLTDLLAGVTGPTVPE